MNKSLVMPVFQKNCHPVSVAQKVRATVHRGLTNLFEIWDHFTELTRAVLSPQLTFCASWLGP
jgi:hypothetical protein